MPKATRPAPRYQQIISKLFATHFRSGDEVVPFSRDECERISAELGIKLPKNLGDVFYSFRYRIPLPEDIRRHAKPGLNWVIEGTGRGKYQFKQVALSVVTPRANMLAIKVPDATPEIIAAYALSDEQALLAKVRYNRLIDIFLGMTASSLQNHLRTTVKGVGQIEIDEIYVGVDRFGRQFVVPVQAKSGRDLHGSVQTQQDIRCCVEKFPQLICRAISVQFVDKNLIAMFELTVQAGQLRVIDERHYQLVAATEISSEDLRNYATRSSS